MGNARKTVPSTQFISAGVDFLSIYQTVFSSILTIRGNDAYRRGHVVLRADETGITENGESFLNAFYRSLGLPAIRDDALIVQSLPDLKKSGLETTQNETINYFNASSIEGGQTKNDTLAKRESFLSTLSSTKSGAAANSNLVAGLKFMIDPAPADSGINGVDRPSIFPAVVAGDVTVFPLARRICPIFFPGEFQDGTQPASRSFIESVIYNSLFKTAKTPASNELIAAIVQQTGQQSLASDLSDKNILVLRFLQKAYSALAGASAQYFKVLNNRDALQRRVSYVPALKKSGPGVKQGYYDLQYYEVAERLKDDPEGQELLRKLPQPEIDAQIKTQSDELAELDAFYDMLPHNIMNTEAQSFSESSGLFDSTPARMMFADLVVDIATLDRPRKADALAKSLEEQRILRNNMEVVRSQLEIFTGTTTGLSIFDILAFFIAFYLMDEKHIIGLLNDTAIERLKGRSTSAAFSNIGLEAAINGRADVSESLNRLEGLVKEQLSLAQKLFIEASGNKT